MTPPFVTMFYIRLASLAVYRSERYSNGDKRPCQGVHYTSLTVCLIFPLSTHVHRLMKPYHIRLDDFVCTTIFHIPKAGVFEQKALAK